jgi:plasmid stabilization system protein ParE
MSYSTELLFKARLELSQAWLWYEDKQPGLGDKFKKQVYTSLEIIEKDPERYPERRKYYRQTLIKGFPYLVIYRIHKRKKVIAIISIFHTKRNPGSKYK